LSNQAGRIALGLAPPLPRARAVSSAAPPDSRSEAEVQAEIVAALRQRGYIVLETSQHRRARPCPHCGQLSVPSGGMGHDAGVPDLLVSHPAWLRGVWMGLECKGGATVLSREQVELLDA